MNQPKINLGTLGSPEWIQNVACVDPRLAMVFLTCCAPPGWEILNILGRWEAGAANTSVPAMLSSRLDSDLLVLKVMYTVRRPSFLPGNVLKAQSDFYNMKNPNIDVELHIKSYCSYFIAQDPTPLENIDAAFDCVCPVGLVLKCNSNIRATFTNRRAFTEGEGGEVPVDAVISLHGVTMPQGAYNSCDVSTAIATLKSRGILPPSYGAPLIAE